MNNNILELVDDNFIACAQGVQNRLNKTKKYGKISFFQPHVILSFLLKNKKLADLKNLKYSDSYYFDIVLKGKENKKGKLRISNHTANLTTTSRNNEVNLNDGITYQLSIVLNETNFNMPENGNIGNVINYETVFNECDVNTIKKLYFKCIEILANGYTIYDEINGKIPKIRTEQNAVKNDIDKKINNIKKDIELKTQNTFDTASINNDSNHNNGIIGSIPQHSNVKILSRSERARQTREMNALKKKNEIEKRKELDKERNRHYVEEIDVSNNKVTVFIDGKKVNNNTIQKVLNYNGGKIAFYLPFDDFGYFTKMGYYHCFVNGEPYYTIKVNDKKGDYLNVVEDDNMFKYVTENLKNKKIMNENLDLEYGIKGMHNKPLPLSPSDRRKLDLMYMKILSSSNSFISNSNNFEDWTFCSMGEGSMFPPFYFVVNYVKPIRPTDINNVDKTFTAIKIRLTRHFIGNDVPENMQNEVVELIVSLSEIGVKRFDAFIAAMKEAKTFQANGVIHEQNPTMINYVFKMNDATLDRIAQQEKLNEKKLFKLISECIREEIKKLL